MPKKHFKGSNNQMSHKKRKKKKGGLVEAFVDDPVTPLTVLQPNFDNCTKISMKYGKFHYQIARLRRTFNKRDP